MKLHQTSDEASIQICEKLQLTANEESPPRAVAKLRIPTENYYCLKYNPSTPMFHSLWNSDERGTAIYWDFR